MHFGVMMFVTDYSMSAPDLAVAAEERGFESMWIPEHTHIPTSRKSAFPGGGELPKPYYDVMDPFIALGAAASVTKTIKLATGICLVIQRDPLQTAKEVATLDQISGGRFIFGVGAGWNLEEMADHGTDPQTRGRLMNERIEAMKIIWANDKAEYHGEFVNFDEMMTWPKPVQQPHPPIVVGGGFPHGARRAIALGDEWMPVGGRDADVVNIKSQFRQMAAEAGREPDSLGISVYGAPGDVDGNKRLADNGITRSVFRLPSEKTDAVLPLLDKAADIMRQITG
mgnify:FL=1